MEGRFVRVELSIGDFLRRAALVYPTRVAVVDETLVPFSLGTLSYASLAARASTLASRLEALGVPLGGRVAIVSPNSARFLIAFFGVSAYGRVLVPINFRLNAEEISYIIAHSGAEVVLYDPELREVMAGVDHATTICLDGVGDQGWFDETSDLPAPTAWAGREDDTCSINYTSGTTARPKGVQLTHRNCWLNATTFGWHLGVSDRDVLLHTLPMFHCNGWGMPYASTAMGARHIVIRKIDGEEILTRVEEHAVTLLCCAPAVIASVLEAGRLRREAGRSLPGRDRVRVVVAGAPPPSKIIERVEDELGWEFVQIYGLTETSPLLTINRAPSEWDELGAAERSLLLSRAGVPAVGVEIAIDQDGEVLARANHVFAGYWEQPHETASALAGGWFHTGDGGYLDGAQLTITDRKKDVIITGGENVSSIEVEDCLFQHPAVAEVAVIGIPSEKWGEAVTALVVLRDGHEVSAADLIEHCRASLAHFKAPQTIEFRQELARTATGKLQKFKLREPFWAAATETSRDRA
jgi:acyl-CoA synthetase (AMP-forming)/AMP-acid ligase II